MLTWEELAQAAPEIASHGRELIERFQFVLVGTLTKDGSPRITPVEAYIIDGHLLANMIPQSLKARVYFLPGCRSSRRVKSRISP